MNKLGRKIVPTEILFDFYNNKKICKIILSGQKAKKENLIAICDFEDYDKVKNLRWLAYSGKKTYYAKATLNNKRLLLHRIILGVSHDSNILVDHKDGNGLNNLRENLRECNFSQNSFNKRKFNKFKGIRDNGFGSYTAEITFNNEWFYLGTFKKEQDAAKAYDIKAIEFFGDFACLNFPDEDYSECDRPIRTIRLPYDRVYFKGNSWRFGFYFPDGRKSERLGFSSQEEALLAKEKLMRELYETR